MVRNANAYSASRRGTRVVWKKSTFLRSECCFKRYRIDALETVKSMA